MPGTTPPGRTDASLPASAWLYRHMMLQRVPQVLNDMGVPFSVVSPLVGGAEGTCATHQG